MSWFLLFLLVIVILLLPTAYAGYIGAPYVPSRRPAVRKALDMLGVGSGDTFIDLGAGDGGVVIEAARREATARGFELSPIMWLVAQLHFFLLPLTKGEREGVNIPPPKWRRPVIKFANFYNEDISDATIVFIFLMPNSLPRLIKYLKQQHIPKGKLLLSYSFPLPGLQPVNIIRTESFGTVYVYNLKELTR